MEGVDSVVPNLHSVEHFSDEKMINEKESKESVEVASELYGDVYDDSRAVDLGADGKERPIETDVDVATRLISLEDDPTLPVFTFRLWFFGLGLSCFGAVLGQIFYFRPQTVYVSPLFLQIIAYILGIVLEEIVPGPNARFRTPNNAFWRFMNPGPFSKFPSSSILYTRPLTGSANREEFGHDDDGCVCHYAGRMRCKRQEDGRYSYPDYRNPF